MDKPLWARFGEATTAPHAIQWLSARYERLVKQPVRDADTVGRSDRSSSSGMPRSSRLNRWNIK